MSKHAPGPWKAENFVREVYVVRDNNGMTVGDAVGEPNARLIARATEMYDLLLKLAEDWGWFANINWDDTDGAINTFDRIGKRAATLIGELHEELDS